MTSQYNAPACACAVGTLFRAIDDALANPVDLKLLSVKEHSTRGANLESFSLLLQGSHASPLTQGIYTIQHDDLGSEQLFITSVGRDADGLFYEIVFNRFINPDSIQSLSTKETPIE